MTKRSDEAREPPHPTDILEGRASGAHAPADDEEIVYYEGSPLLRGELGLVLTWFFIGAALIAIPIVWAMMSENGPPWWAWLLIVLGIAAILFPALWVKRHRYKITNYRIDYEFGLISSNVDTLELWHVNDIRMRQGPIDLLFGVGTIKIDADDKSTPDLELRSLHKPRPLYENLKQRVIAVKRQRGVIKMDIGA
jgi:membrane protein YdbS with pleckstrin-like domain